MSNEESKNDVVKPLLDLFPRATPRPWRADRHDIVGGEGKNYVALVCVGGTRTGNANRDLILDAVNSYDALRSEVAELRRCNATQEESITHLQSQLRVMKEAVEAALLHLQDCGYKTNKEVQEQLIAAISPKGSEQ